MRRPGVSAPAWRRPTCSATRRPSRRYRCPLPAGRPAAAGDADLAGTVRRTRGGRLMTPAELVPVPGRAPAVRRRPRAEADARTRRGERISASAARKLINAVPENSRDARATRCAPTVCGARPTTGPRTSPTRSPRTCPISATADTRRRPSKLTSRPCAPSTTPRCLTPRSRPASSSSATGRGRRPTIRWWSRARSRPTPSPWRSCAGWSALRTAPQHAAGRSPSR